jgi:hypothetical protein
MMKHRSIVIFILVVAALAVAPQIGKQLNRVAAVAANHAEGALWNAFLSLHAQKQTGAAERREQLLTNATRTQKLPTTPAIASSRGKASAAPNVAKQQHNAASFDRRSKESIRAQKLFEQLPLTLLARFQPEKLDRHFDVEVRTNLGSKEALGIRERDFVALRDAARSISLLDGAENKKGSALRLTQFFDRRASLNNVRREARRKRTEEKETGAERIEAAPQPKIGKTKAQAKAACPLPPTEPQQQPAFVTPMETTSSGFMN